MKRQHLIIYIYSMLMCAFCLISCIDEDEYEESPIGNFEALWKIIDEHYCFFDYKNKSY